MRDEMPVLHIEKHGAHRVADAMGLRCASVLVDHRDRCHQHERGQQSSRTTEPEFAELDASVIDALAQEERGDQVAREHEEHVDAQEPATTEAVRRCAAPAWNTTTADTATARTPVERRFVWEWARVPARPQVERALAAAR
jgi:hypothetical protein